MDDCKHKFETSKTIVEYPNQGTTSSMIGIGIEYAYIICTKCGEVRKVLVGNFISKNN